MHFFRSGNVSSTEWKSFKLTKRNILPLLTVDVLLAAGLVVIFVLSDRQNGFNIPAKQSSRTGSIEWQLSLTWTFLPSFTLQVFALWFANTVDAIGFRQPFIELARGASAARSIHLDYSSFWPVQREYKALRNRHWHLFCLFTLSLVLKPVLGPLGAHLLAEGSYTREVNLVQDAALLVDVSPTGQMGWNLPTVISLTAARLIDSSYGRWSNGNQTFLNFSIPSTSSTDISPPRLIAATPAYFSTLNCSSVQSLEQHLRFVADTNDTTTSGRVFVSDSDNGCNWTVNTAFSATTPTHMETSSTTRCSDITGRLIVLNGVINSTTDHNLLVLSCTPSYWNSTVDLSLDLAGNQIQPIVGWNEQAGSIKVARPEWWNIYEDQLQEQLSSPDLSGGSLSEATTPMGKVILDRIRALSVDPLDQKTLVSTVTEVWVSLYSTLLETYMIQLTENPTDIIGNLTTTGDRLFVVKPIVAIVLAVLGVVAVALVVIFVYTRRHLSVLREEPIGVLGHADLLVDSYLSNEIKKLRRRQDFNGKASKIFLEEHARSTEVTTFKMFDLDDTRQRRIGAEPRTMGTAQEVPLIGRSVQRTENLK